MNRPYAHTAERYLELGWQGVLPVGLEVDKAGVSHWYPQRKKSPPAGYTGRSGGWPDPSTIRRWTARPDIGACNLALRVPDGLVGVDVDEYGAKHGLHNLLAFQNEHDLPELPLAATIRSTSRGAGQASGIYWFCTPTGLRWTSAPCDDVEIVQHGHRYAIVWPSTHPDGGTYNWFHKVSESIDPPSLDDARILWLPDEWADALTRPEEIPAEHPPAEEHWEDDWSDDVTRVHGLFIDRLGTASDHETARGLMLALCRLEQQDHPGATAAIGSAGEYFVAAVTDPSRDGSVRSNHEARTEWQRLLTGGRRRTQTTESPSDDLSWIGADATHDVGRNGSDGNKVGDLPPKAPIPPNTEVEQPWPELDPVALHGPAGEAVRLLDPHTEADPAAVLASLLAGWGAIVGSGPHARAGHVHHPARISVVIVGDTAKARKGTSWATAGLLLDQVDPMFMIERVLGGFGSGEAVVDEVRDPQPNPQDPDKDDPGASDKRLIIYDPEFARVLKICTRETSILSGIIRDAWDGSRLQTRARSRKAVATGHHVAIVGHITAPELRRNLTETEIAGGFANRLLWICARRSKRLAFGGNPDEAALRDLGKTFTTRATTARSIGTVQFDQEGRDLWESLYEEMAEDDPGGMLGAIVARPEPQTLRLALTYALLDGERLIGADHILAAWALWQYSRAGAAYIWGDAIGDEMADRLLRAIRKAGPAGLDRTEIRGVAGSNNVPARRIDTALAELERRGLIETETVPPESGKGRPRAVSRIPRRT